MPSRARRVVLLLTLVLVTGLNAAPAAPAPAAPAAVASARGVPSEQQWERDVQRVMAGSGTYLADRARRGAAPGRRLAVNLDVDNTMLASFYDPGAPVRPVLRFARRAQARGIAVLVNTARPESQRAQTRRQLQAAGYDVNRLCLGRADRAVVAGKQDCRRGFREQGFTLVANVGNNGTDFVRGAGANGYGRAYDLPDYDRRLG